MVPRLTLSEVVYTRSMLKKYLAIGSSIFLLIIIGAFVYRDSSTAPEEIEAQDASWAEAITILHSGEVAQVTQLHNLTVTLILKDGTRIVTKEPAIDDIWDEVHSCGTPCDDMIMATE